MAMPIEPVSRPDVFDFIVRSGRALLYPVYKDTFERRRPPEPTGPSAMRDRQVAWAKDVFRAVDYLETRPEIDTQRLAYYSLSMGAYFGPIPIALEPRLKTAVLLAGGLRYNYPPEIDPSNFMPRVKVPVLLINGKDDYGASAAARQRFIELLGTPLEHKQSVDPRGRPRPDRLARRDPRSPRLVRQVPRAGEVNRGSMFGPMVDVRGSRFEVRGSRSWLLLLGDPDIRLRAGAAVDDRASVPR